MPCELIQELTKRDGSGGGNERRSGGIATQFKFNMYCHMAFKQKNVTDTKSTAHTIKCKVGMFGGTGWQLEERIIKLRRRAVNLATHISN